MSVLEEHVSPDRLLTLVVEDVGEGDLAIGFKNCPWHTHADVLADLSGLNEAMAVRQYVDGILADTEVVAVLRIRGVLSDAWPTDDPEASIRDHQQYGAADEDLELRYWSGEPYKIIDA